MTKKEFTTKTKELIKDCKKEISKESNRLFESGAIDPDDYKNDFVLPKIILTVALENWANNYYMLSKAAKQEVKNLKYF